jgi:hypothetical protein
MKKKSITLIAIVLFYGLFAFAVYRLSMTPDIQAEPPVWNGVVTGVTTEQEVVAILGEPANVKRTLFRTIYQYEVENLADFPSRHPFFNEIYFRAGKVDYIIENILVQDGEVTLNTLLRLHGKPERSTFSDPHFGANGVLYCEQGFIATISGNIVFYKIYFEPQSIKACMRKFRFALPGYWKGPEDILAEEDPWGFNEDE